MQGTHRAMLLDGETVPAGIYVLAYTCDPDQPGFDADAVDTPAGADEIVNFTPEHGTAATVTAINATTVNFTVPAPQERTPSPACRGLSRKR